MKFAESHPNLAAFVLDGLEPEEAAVIRHHLARCPDCRRELRELEKVNSALKAAPPLEDPQATSRTMISPACAPEISLASPESRSGCDSPSPVRRQSVRQPCWC
jgi:Putative zinc-finger